jgi:hypothetical protein
MKTSGWVFRGVQVVRMVRIEIVRIVRMVNASGVFMGGSFWTSYNIAEPEQPGRGSSLPGCLFFDVN